MNAWLNSRARSARKLKKRTLSLSLMRAEAVREYLIVHGIDPARMTSVGYGEDRPIADNGTAEGRRTNRRVELVRTDAGAGE